MQELELPHPLIVGQHIRAHAPLPADFRAEGERTGKYKIAGEMFTTNAKGESFISYADYAAAMLDVIEGGKYADERISVYTE